jgi:hypothetical protein
MIRPGRADNLGGEVPPIKPPHRQPLTVRVMIALVLIGAIWLLLL